MDIFKRPIRVAVSITLVATALAAQPAAAGPYQDEAPTARVTTKGIDLTTFAGRDALRAKVALAARLACSHPDEPRYTEAMPGEQRCVDRAIAQAEPQVALAIRRALPSDEHLAVSDQALSKRRDN